MAQYKPKKANEIKLKSYIETKDERNNKRERRRSRTKQRFAIYQFFRSRTGFTNCFIDYINNLYIRKV